VYDYFAEHKKKLLADYEKWEQTYNAWRTKNPDKAKILDDGVERRVPADLFSKIPDFPKDAKLATRKAGGEVLQPIAQAMPLLMSGSADLYGSTMNYIEAAAISIAITLAGATSGSAFANMGCARF
jgi:Transketolase